MMSYLFYVDELEDNEEKNPLPFLGSTGRYFLSWSYLSNLPVFGFLISSLDSLNYTNYTYTFKS